MPRLRDCLVIQVKKDKNAFYFFIALFFLFLLSFIYKVFEIGLVSYFLSISLKDIYSVSFFVLLAANYFIRLSIYMNLYAEKLTKGSYVYDLWRISANDCSSGVNKIALHVVNIIVILMFLLVLLNVN